MSNSKQAPWGPRREPEGRPEGPQDRPICAKAPPPHSEITQSLSTCVGNRKFA